MAGKSALCLKGDVIHFSVLQAASTTLRNGQGKEGAG
jgi:hypothetical protein